MGLRDFKKEKNRQLILAAAEKIIKEEGEDALTMRHLAEVAQVATRTPTNLFQSKYGVFAAFRDRIITDVAIRLEQSSLPDGYGALIGALDIVIEMFRADEVFYQSIVRGLSQPNNSEDFDGSLILTRAVIVPILTNAMENNELEKTCRPQVVADHIVFQMIGLINLWGMGQISLEAFHQHSKLMFYSSFMPHVTPETQAEMLAEVEQISQKLEA